MDTDASVRALAPSSIFGGSRESLPLSVLSTAHESHGAGTASGLTTAAANLASRFGGAGAERASVYSSTGVAPALASERNSFYGRGEGSVRSGMAGHGHAREGSITGSFIGSPLAAVASREDKGKGVEKGEERSAK